MLQKFCGLIGVAILACAVTSPTFAAGVILGPFCIEGIKFTQDFEQKTTTPDGDWVPTKLNYQKPDKGPSKARISLFDRPLPKFVDLPTCKEAASRAKASGGNMILSGSIDKLAVSGEILRATSGDNNRIQIPASGFVLEVGSVDAGTQRLNGGLVNFKGGKITVSNPTQLLGGASTLTGLVQIELPNRQISNMRLVASGGAVMQSTFAQASPDADPLVVRINMATRIAELWSGDLKGTSVNVTGPSLVASSLAFSQPSMKISAVELSAKAGLATLEFKSGKGKASGLTWKHRSAVSSFATPTLVFDAMTGTGRSGANQLNLTLSSLKNVNIRSPSVTLGVDIQGDLLSGPAEASFVTISNRVLDGSLRYSAVDAPNLHFFIPASAMRAAVVNVMGAPDNPEVSGHFDLRAVALAGMTLSQALPLNFKISNFVHDLRIPVKFDIGDKGGSFSLTQKDQALVLSAGIKRAYLDATLVVDFAELKQSHLDVPRNKFELGLVSAVASQPMVAGVAPAFGDVEVKVKAKTALRVGLENLGRVDIEPNLLIVAHPVMKIGASGSETKVDLTIQSQGSARFAYDLAAGTIRLVKAIFIAENADFHLVDSGAKIDVSGISVTDPALKMAVLRIDYDQDAVVKVGTAQLLNFKLAAGAVEKPRLPEKPNEIAFKASITTPLSIGELDAEAVQVDKAITMEAISIRDFAFALSGALVDFGQSMRVTDAALSLGATRLSSSQSDGHPFYEFESVNIVADGRLNPGDSTKVRFNSLPGIHVALRASGDSDHLNGVGSVSLGSFGGEVSSPADLSFIPCDNNVKLSAPERYRFDSGGFSASASLQNGIIEAEGNIGSLKITAQDVTRVECEYLKHTVSVPGNDEAQKVCKSVFGLFGASKVCNVVDAEASIWLNNSAIVGPGYFALPETVVEIGNRRPLKLCTHGVIISALAISANAEPRFDAPFASSLARELQKLVNFSDDVLKHAAAAVGESLLTSTIFNIAGHIGCL